MAEKKVPPAGQAPLARVAPRSASETMKAVAAPPPPPNRPRRRRSPFLAALSGLLSALLIAAVLLGAGYFAVDRASREPGPLVADKALIIPAGSGLQDIALLLEREGIIANPLAFRIVGVVSGAWSQLRAGEYLFKAALTQREALDVLTSGRPILHTVTVPEGLTSEQIVQRLRENDLLTGEIAQVPREGTILPDTYRVERGMSRTALLREMAAKQRTLLEQVWARRVPDLPLRTPQELVTLASIVEKETGRADERARVAGVFVNRLNRRMKLQSDPTIVYGLVGGKGTLGRGILRSEITQATAYNTYVIDGLPPGPIANPGRAAMEAVANPGRTRDLFFVADGTGGHAFAETLEQHNRNVARWRQVEAQRRDPARPSAEASVDRVDPPPGPTAAPLTDRRSEGPAEGGRPEIAPLATYPVPPGRLPSATSGAASGGGPARARAFDASEGTARDPLRNRNFDLNSPQRVPTLRP